MENLKVFCVLVVKIMAEIEIDVIVYVKGKEAVDSF